MSVSRAAVPTEHASKYLQQLCKHWGHKRPVEFDSRHGSVQFDTATCRFEAEPGLLRVEIESADGDEARRMEGVVARHLERFAFREQLSFDWRNEG
jgi:hypothetical protein